MGIWVPGIYCYDTADYLTMKCPMNIASNSFFIAGNVCPDEKLVAAISSFRSVNVFFTEMS
ncbi:MAG: putative sugar nucleotidyl transferase [Coprobacter fastidiosus]